MNQRQHEIWTELRQLGDELESINHRLPFAEELEAYGVYDYGAAIEAGRKTPREMRERLAWINARIPELQREYDRVADHAILIKYGRDVYDVLKGKYPDITHKTKVQDCADYGTSIAYALPTETKFWRFPAESVPEWQPYETRVADFIEIACDDRRIGKFAYAPEIDTVFVAKQR